jgi:hypothetical protein
VWGVRKNCLILYLEPESPTLSVLLRIRFRMLAVCVSY